MYNTHDGPVEGARAAGGGGRQGLPMYEVRGTMYDLDYSARCAGIWQSKCGRALMKLCAECGVAFVVASAVGLWYNPPAGSAKAGKII